MMKAKSSVSRSPTRPAVPPSVAEELAPPPPSIAPTTAPTMPLRIRPAPSAASQPNITLSQLVPRLSLPSRCASLPRCASRELYALHHEAYAPRAPLRLVSARRLVDRPSCALRRLCLAQAVDDSPLRVAPLLAYHTSHSYD